jgi:serpin B
MKTIILSITFFITRLAFSHPIALDSNHFAIDLYQVGNNPENRCFSPYSIFRCLSIAYLGAQGETAEQMQNTLHLSLSSDELPCFFADIQSNLINAQVKIADALWIEKGSSLHPSFKQSIDEMQSSIGIVNFKNKETTISQINDWVSKQTEGNISQLLSTNDISNSTRLILTNTVYFKGLWTFPFSHGMTKSSTFYKKNGTVPIQMMQQLHTFSYFENELCQIVLLPIANSSCNCFFILPKHTIENVEASLEKLSYWLQSTKPALIDLQLPKFEVRQATRIKDLLFQMGIKKAFSVDADFSLMLQKESLHLDQVIHEAFFFYRRNRC